jgi:hypothetical protein
METDSRMSRRPKKHRIRWEIAPLPEESGCADLIVIVSMRFISPQYLQAWHEISTVSGRKMIS